MCLSDSAKILVKAKKKHPKQQPKKEKKTKNTTTNKQVNCLRWRINKLYLISNKKSQLPHTFSLPLHLGGQVVLSAAEGDKQGFMDELTAEQSCGHPAFCITSHLLGWFLPEEAGREYFADSHTDWSWTWWSNQHKELLHFVLGASSVDMELRELISNPEYPHIYLRDSPRTSNILRFFQCLREPQVHAKCTATADKDSCWLSIGEENTYSCILLTFKNRSLIKQS